MKIYYDHGQVLSLRLPEQSTSVEELQLLRQRLQAVTKGALDVRTPTMMFHE